MRGRDMRTKLGAPGADDLHSEDQEVRSHFQAYQDKYLSRCNERTGELPKWKPGDMVRVRAPFGFKRKYGPPLRIAAQLGPVTYKLAGGQKVHARRLAAAKKGRSEPAEDCWDIWYPAQGGDAVPDPAPPRATAPNPIPPQPSTPCALRRGMRERHEPNRYSP